MMVSPVSKRRLVDRIWRRGFVLGLCLVFSLAVLLPALPLSASDRLVDDKEYKDKDFHKGIITDYSDMVKGDDVNWVWVKPGEKLSQYKLKVGTLENKSDMHSKSLSDSVKGIFADYFSDYESKGSKGTLTAELCITEVQEYSQARAYIPFTGGRMAQAGMGIEMVLRDSRNEIIAKLRHFDRRGSEVRGAAEDVASHMMQYISKH